MSKKIENNIKNNNNTQYFSDSIYYALPPFNKGVKLWILLAFNNNLMKTILYTICLIKNENKETILKILDYFFIIV